MIAIEQTHAGPLGARAGPSSVRATARAARGGVRLAFWLVGALSCMIIGGISQIALAEEKKESEEEAAGERVSMGMVKQHKMEENEYQPLKVPDAPKEMRQRHILHTAYEWAKSILNHHRLHEKMKEQAVIDPHRDTWLKKAALVREEQHSQRYQQASATFSQETMSIFGEEISNRSESLRSLSHGMQFRLDLGSLWADSPPKVEDPIRYGLILENIEAQEKSESRWDEEGVVTRWTAKPRWRIGPQRKDSEHPYRVHVLDESQPPSGISSRVFGKIIPNGSPVGGGGQLGMPSLNLLLAQEQGYYEINLPVSPQVETARMEHIVRVPLVEAFHVSQKLDSNLIPVETGLNHILVHPWAPQVNLLYNYKEELYVSQYVYDGSDYKLSMLGKLPARQAHSGLAAMHAEMAYLVNL